MANITRENVNVYFERHGSPDAPTVLLSHGYSATAAMWRQQVEALSSSYDVIVWDMRGHGQSDSPADPGAYSEQTTVEDMVGIMDACGVDSAVIAGLSLGGYMSLAFHLAHPGRCRALMLFDTGPGYKNAEARAGWNQTAEARAEALEQNGLAALGAGQEVRVAMHRSAQGLAHAARGMLAQVDDRIIRSLPDIKVPTLVLVGENDQPFRIPTDYMAAKIPNAQKVVIPGAGHASNIDQPNDFNTAVGDFLHSLD